MIKQIYKIFLYFSNNKIIQIKINLNLKETNYGKKRKK